MLLQLRGGRMSYMKLIKLLYILDREALCRWGRPVTTDCYVSMDRGPVLSRTLNLITEESTPHAHSFWVKYISEPEHYEVRLQGEPNMEELSEAEIALIQEVFAVHGRKSRWDLVNLTHAYPEWQNPCGSAIPIEYRDILRAGGKTEGEIAAIEEELDGLAFADSLLAQ